MADDFSTLTRNILRDIGVEIGDELDRNFDRQAFFSEAWARRRSPGRQGGSLLVDTGSLRRSIQRTVTDRSITFSSGLPYAEIHNEGGEIAVTARMKRYFWAKWYEATGAFGRRKDGSLRKDGRNSRLTEEAEFWRCMALMRVGSRIRIPQRRFIGTAPEIEKAVTRIIEENLDEYFNNKFDFTK